jgi:hypothetical protein
VHECGGVKGTDAGRIDGEKADVRAVAGASRSGVVRRRAASCGVVTQNSGNALPQAMPNEVSIMRLAPMAAITVS